MDTFRIVLSIVYMLICFLLITFILLQKKRSAGLGAGMAGMGSEQTYWDRNKGRSMEGKLEKYSKILGAVFLIMSVILCII